MRGHLKGRRALRLALLLSLPIPLSPVGAGGVTNLATETTQLLNNAELLAIHGIDVEQLENMLRNTLPAAGQAWTRTTQDLLDLHQAVQRGIGIAYSNSAWEALFQQRYPGYATFAAGKDYVARYQDWIQGTLDGIRGALAAAHLQMDQLGTEDAIIERLKTLSATTRGRHQALMVGNMVKTETVQQLRKLRELQMAQLQLHLAYQSTQTQLQAEREAMSKKLFELDPCKALSARVRAQLTQLTGASLPCP